LVFSPVFKTLKYLVIQGHTHLKLSLANITRYRFLQGILDGIIIPVLRKFTKFFRQFREIL